MLSKEQIQIIQDFRAGDIISIMQLEDLSNGMIQISNFEDLAIGPLARLCNTLYRAGCPVVSNDIYDSIILKRLAELDPDNEILNSVEPEEVELSGEMINHPVPMLSTNKAYTLEAVQKELLDRAVKEAEDLGISPADIRLRITAKLDGLAGRDDGVGLYTRGDGMKGYDVSRIFDSGLQVMGVDTGNNSRGQGLGEIVVLKSYFDRILSEDSEHPRNFMVGLTKADTLRDIHIETLKSGSAVFMPYADLPSWEGTIDELLADYENIVERIRNSVDSYIDGIVLQVQNPEIQDSLGSNREYNRWQIAIKQNTEEASVIVNNIIPQTGRTGKVTPVAELEPVYLSGATISRATLHHYGKVRDQNIGIKTIGRIVRSGEVIPKWIETTEATNALIPTHCPSCNSELEWEENDKGEKLFLYCRNTSACEAQVETSILHWFKTMATMDGFGPASVSKLVDFGIKSISEIFAMKEDDFIAAGFGNGQMRNLMKELSEGPSRKVEDWRFLASFGIKNLGRGSSEKLLSNVSIDKIYDLTADDIEQFDGFGKVTKHVIEKGIQDLKEEISKLKALGFELELTEAFDPETAASLEIAGKNILFTGKMQQGSRDDMKKQAKALGAKVQSSVNGKTDILVCGENAGDKQNKAKELRQKGQQIQILTEAEYINLIS